MSEGTETGSGYEVLSRWYSGLGGFFTAVAAAVLAFFVGGLVVVATGHDPFAAYKAIFSGTGLSWFSRGCRETSASAPRSTCSRR